MQAALAALPPMERLVLTMISNGKSYREIAETIGWRSPSAVVHWVKKARREFSEKVEIVEQWLGR